MPTPGSIVVGTDGSQTAERAVDRAGEIADEQQAQMIVVGNLGMTGARRAVGSVPNRVSHHVRCDVLIVTTT